MVKIILFKSPDEWATTKQVCRDELVVYLSFFSHNICMYVYTYKYIYIYKLSSFAKKLQKHVTAEVLWIQFAGRALTQ